MQSLLKHRMAHIIKIACTYTWTRVCICTYNIHVDISFPITQTMKRVKICSQNWSLPHIQKDGLILGGVWPLNSEELESYLKLFKLWSNKPNDECIHSMTHRQFLLFYYKFINMWSQFIFIIYKGITCYIYPQLYVTYTIKCSYNKLCKYMMWPHTIMHNM